MEYIDQVKDYLNKCQKNLDIVKKNKGFEFTQLFCNFISALIFIKENREIHKQDIKKYNLTFKVINNSYPINFKIDAQEFIRHLRNACCHYGIKIDGNNDEISKVIFEDKNVNKKTNYANVSSK